MICSFVDLSQASDIEHYYVLLSLIILIILSNVLMISDFRMLMR